MSDRERKILYDLILYGIFKKAHRYIEWWLPEAGGGGWVKWVKMVNMYKLPVICDAWGSGVGKGFP